jgi:hypothetical protein
MRSLAWTVVAAACALPIAAHAQVYKWIDENGKVRYGDTPPPKAKAKVIATPSARGSASPAQPGAAAKGKDARKGPLTPAEKEMEFRRRAKEAQTADAKAEKERQDKEARRLNCDSAQQSLRTLESGQRISRTDAQGERYFLDEGQIAQETARARQAVSQWCQ